MEQEKQDAVQFIKEVLIEILKTNPVEITFPNLNLDLDAVIHTTAFRALWDIKKVIEDEALDDFECIEQIVSILESYGSDGGARHDF